MAGCIGMRNEDKTRGSQADRHSKRRVASRIGTGSPEGVDAGRNRRTIEFFGTEGKSERANDVEK